ncbi:SdrD B-like domain-containing protein [Calothrix sp. CCY 0018]|uniref:SdrD B-like domain-containing protein n=1 Tax=Calothrix sp. CCY 0018 TaxID=3103864 RepID=UPI0039C65AE8
MKALFKHLSAITQGETGSVADNTSYLVNKISTPFLSTTLLAVLLGVPQIPIIGSGKAVAQNTGSCPAGTAPATVQLNPSDSLQDLIQEYNVGGIGTVLSITEEVPGQVIDRTESRVDDGIYGGIQGPDLRLNIGPGKPPETGNLAPGSATVTITFAQSVTLASPLTLLDVDQEGPQDNRRFFRDIVTVSATNNNSNVPVNLQALGPFTQVSGNTASGINGNSLAQNGDANVSVTPQGPIDQISIVYTPDESQPRGQDQSIGLAPFTICAPGNLASIGDTVYRDTNGDGTQNPGEEGIPGINLTLTNPGPDGQFGTPDDTTETTTTDNNGIYNFPVTGGNYRVTVDNPPAGLTPTQTPPGTIVVAAGENFDTADFGFSPQQTGSIGDTVYTDGNRNNVQDEGEEGIPGATVSLVLPGPDGQFGTPDDTTQTTTTNDNGNYTFPNLPAGTYRVTATSPREGDTPTQTQPDTIELQPGQNLDTVDFGFVPEPVGQGQGTGSLGDTVYNDLNNNGQQDEGEPGIGGVIVNYAGTGPDGVFGESLTDDDTSGRTSTDANGRYTFPNLPAGTYRVTINDQSQPEIQGLSQTQTPNNPIALGEGENIDTADFGYTQATGTIGDTVYRDNNSDGTQNEGEPGIPNVEVTLINPGPDGQFGTPDDTTQNTTTNENGIYSFPNIPIGNYQVVVNNPPEDLSPTQTPPTTIPLQADQTFNDADFGFSPQQVGTIGDLVFFDNDGDSTPDGNESGISGINLVLRDAQGNQVATTTTEEDGSYNFVAPPGTYTVTVANPPQGLTPTLTQPNPVNLEAGQNIDTVDFGFQPPTNGSIGDTVFADVNANRIQDQGEPGVSGVLVRLIRPGDDGVFGTNDDQIDEQRTDNTETVAFNQNTPGQYTFNNLPPGNYQVEIVLPDGSILTTAANPIPVTLEPSQNFVDADFGVRMTGLPGSIGDTVFNDTDGDGVQDFTDSNNNGVKDANEEGEEGIPGVQVTLRDSDGDTVATTTTNENGNYVFNSLPLGTYTVEAARPTDFSPTTETTLPAQLTQANPTTNEVDFGFRPGRLGASGPTNLRLVKRITNVLRGNTPISGVAFNQFEDDSNDEDDNRLNSSPQSSPVGITRLETPVVSGDIVEYTIYFLSEGGEALQNVRVCDLVPDGTTFVNGSIAVNGGGNGADNGNFSSPLAPIPANFQNICRNGTPTNGAVLTNLGTLPAGGQFGFVRFRVRVN